MGKIEVARWICEFDTYQLFCIAQVGLVSFSGGIAGLSKLRRTLVNGTSTVYVLQSIIGSRVVSISPLITLGRVSVWKSCWAAGPGVSDNQQPSYEKWPPLVQTPFFTRQLSVAVACVSVANKRLNPEAQLRSLAIYVIKSWPRNRRVCRHSYELCWLLLVR